jgi:hypothetical protein
MSFRVTYTRLFVCHVWHAFHLNLGADVRFHDLDPVADAADRADLLRTYDLRNLLDIRPLGDTVRNMAGHRIKLRASPTGFFAGIATGADPAGGRRPMIEPAANQRWYFGLYPRNAAGWANATNQRMGPNVPAIHYFTNNRPDWAAAAPAPLSLAAPAIVRQERSYEAGEIVSDAGQRFRARVAVTNSAIPLADPAFWEAEAPAHAGVTDTDRCLLPSRFTYTITANAGEMPTSLTVQLLDLVGTPSLPSTTHSLAFGKDRIGLDFTAANPGWYDLEITSDTVYATTHRVFLDDELYDPTAWGVVGFGPDATDPSLRLLEVDGRLRQDGGGLTEPPVFEIRPANRRTFWRYVAHPSQTLPAAAGFVLDAANRLVTTDARPLTRFGSPLLLNGGNGPVALPNPPPDTLRPETDGRLYSDGYLGVLDL